MQTFKFGYSQGLHHAEALKSTCHMAQPTQVNAKLVVLDSGKSMPPRKGICKFFLLFFFGGGGGFCFFKTSKHLLHYFCLYSLSKTINFFIIADK